MNKLRKIYDVLKANGIDCYYQGTHKGECLKPYVVIRSSGSMLDSMVSSEWMLFDIMCYVPYGQYSFLEEYVLKVKRTMKQLFPLLFYNGNQTESFYDEDVKGYMISFQYQNIRKTENW